MNRHDQVALFNSRKRRKRRIVGTPVNTVVPAITGTEQVGQTLTCSTGTWTNSPIAYKYEWRRDDAAIAGANQSTYDLVAEDEGADVTCTVRAINNNGSAGATTASVGPIAA